MTSCFHIMGPVGQNQRGYDVRSSSSGEKYAILIAYVVCLCRSLRSVDRFISFIGLDEPPVEPSADDTCGINRSQVRADCYHFWH